LAIAFVLAKAGANPKFLQYIMGHSEEFSPKKPKYCQFYDITSQQLK